MKLLTESITNLTEVSIAIAKHLFSKEEYKEENIVFSPLSLQIILSMIAVGSEGSTQHQLLEFLHANSTNQLKTLCSQLVSYVLADNSPTGGPLVSLVNTVEVPPSISLQPSFKKSVVNNFKATIASVDVVTKALTFTNEVYFKGAWSTRFDESKTKDYDFYLLNGSSVKVPFMTSRDKQFIRVFDGFKVLRLSYEGGKSYKSKDKRNFSIYIYLPDAKDGLLTLIEKVASDSEFLKRTRPGERKDVGHFRIPSFDISFELETCPILKELGVILPFSEGGLTNMVDSPLGEELYVSSIYHKSFIELNEKGTKAYAVTTCKLRCTRSCRPLKPPPPRIDFVADHPFMFLIREDCSGTVLFIGQVLNPKLVKKGPLMQKRQHQNNNKRQQQNDNKRRRSH